MYETLLVGGLALLTGCVLLLVAGRRRVQRVTVHALSWLKIDIRFRKTGA